jgi:hypothetical protein
MSFLDSNLSQTPENSKSIEDRRNYFFKFHKTLSKQISLNTFQISNLRTQVLGNDLSRSEYLQYLCCTMNREHGNRRHNIKFYEDILYFSLNATDAEWSLVTVKTKWD